MIRHLFVLSLLCLASSLASAFQTINESGDLTAVGSYRLGVIPQIRTSNGSGGNLGIFAESGLTDEWSWRAEMGSGFTDFWGTGSMKWIPIPDYNNQPAIGVRGDVSFGRDESENFTVFRAAPMISKGFDTEVGRITPYGAIPFGVFAMKGTSDTISQLVIGSEGKFEGAQGFLFSAELGFNMNKSFSYIAGSVSYYFSDRP